MTDASIPEGRRTAAAWVAATGAFLLLAAAALFVAVRWDQLPDSAKLAALTASTGVALAGGRALRSTLPATGSVVFHLGAFLVPVDVAAVSLRFDLDWRTLLLAEAAAATAAFSVLALYARSSLLSWAAGASAVGVAAGVAAVSPAPAPALLAVAAVTAHLAGRERLATAWAGVAGFAPVVTAAVSALHASSGGSLGLGVARELGVAAGQPAALVAGALAATVLIRQAVGSRDLRRAYLALGAVVSGTLVSWLSVMPRGQSDAVAIAALFLAVEVTALLVVRDSFWKAIAAPVAAAVEAVVAALALPLSAGAVLLAPLADTGLDVLADGPGWAPEPGYGAAGAVVAFAWLAAGLRYGVRSPVSLLEAARATLGSPAVALPFALSAGAAVAIGTASPLAAGVTFGVLAVLLAATHRPAAVLTAAPFAAWAAVTAHATPIAAVVAGSVSTIAMAAFLGRQHALVVGVAAVGAGAASVGGWSTASGDIGWGPAMAGAAVVLWVAAAIAGEGRSWHGNLLRLGLVIPTIVAASQPADQAFIVAATCALLLAIDAWRLRDEAVGIGAGVAVQFPLMLGADLAGLDPAGVGLVLCAAAVVEAGLAGVLWPEWRAALGAAFVASLAAGIALTSADADAFGTALLIAGGIGVALALMTSTAWMGFTGGGVATIGIFVHLDQAGVAPSEPYVAPVALQLVLLGWHLRRVRDLSSWSAYGPAVALLGGAALAERIAGGAGWHAVIAGAVGVSAVIAGGCFRLAAPLLLGTAVLVAVTVFESLSTLAGVPTWAWLGLGGAVLLGTGVGLERADTSPVEAGRRVAEVLAERFD